MREIKFRGVSVDLKKLAYGYLFITEKSNPKHEKTYWIFNEFGKYKIKPETAGQYTGLKDKNGKEIYEGDKDSKGRTVKYGEYNPTMGIGWNNIAKTIKESIVSFTRFRGGQEYDLSNHIANSLKSMYGSISVGWYIEDENGRSFGLTGQNVKSMSFTGNIHEEPK